MAKKLDETQIAQQIVSVLPAGVARTCSAERGSIRYTVRGEGLKLHTIVLNRASLRRLAEDPCGPVKIEYLQRDLIQAAERRSEFRYPRLHLHPVAAPPRRLSFGLTLAAVF